MENATNVSQPECLTLLSTPMLQIDPIDTVQVGENLLNGSYTFESLPEALNETINSAPYYLASYTQDVTDKRQEEIHIQDSIALLIIVFLLFIIIITIWIFNARRIRILHSTGLALLYGVAVGAIIHYLYPAEHNKVIYLARDSPQYEKCNLSVDMDMEEQRESNSFYVGETLHLITEQDNFSCTVDGKLFKDKQGNFIQESLLFDPELFFFALLPPIIFYAGYSLQKRHFFRNLGSLLLYAFVGTTISAFIIGSLMYGYAVSEAEAEGSAFANLTTYPVPDGFKESIVPSLLFGSLISATDPVTVLAVFHDLHVDHDIFSLVFGESVMNDAVAIVLFGAVDEYAQPGDSTFTAEKLFISIARFVGIFFGSFVLGCAMGLITALLMKFSKLREYPLLETSMFVVMSYSTYLVAEACRLTGIVAVLFCGIMQSYYTYINMSEESRKRTRDLFELINFFAENFVFSYIGLSLFTFQNNQYTPGFIMFSFVAIFAGRVVNIYILSFILNLGRAKKISFRFQHMLLFAGLRGAIAFALAIRNTQDEVRQLIFTTTLFIVMVTVLFNGGFTTLALQCLKIKVGVEDDTGGLTEEGQIIPFDSRKGNWLVSKWTKFDKLYLIPLFTHHGRPVTEFNKYCPSCFIPFCNRCKPRDEEGLLDSDGEESSHDTEGGSEDDDDLGQVYSFRNAQEDSDDGDDMEGDLGLGSDHDSKGGYGRLMSPSDESVL